MKTIDPFNADHPVSDVLGVRGVTHSAERVLAGHCPECHAVLVVFNDHESWPLVGCACGWSGGTTEFAHVRLERAEHEPVELTGYFPDGATLRVKRRYNDTVDLLGEVAEVGLVDMHDVGVTPAGRGSTLLRAKVVVRP